MLFGFPAKYWSTGVFRRSLCGEHSNVAGSVWRRGEEVRPIGWSAPEIVRPLNNCRSICDGHLVQGCLWQYSKSSLIAWIPYRIASLNAYWIHPPTLFPAKKSNLEDVCKLSYCIPKIPTQCFISHDINFYWCIPSVLALYWAYINRRYVILDFSYLRHSKGSFLFSLGYKGLIAILGKPRVVRQFFSLTTVRVVESLTRSLHWKMLK